MENHFEQKKGFNSDKRHIIRDEECRDLCKSVTEKQSAVIAVRGCDYRAVKEMIDWLRREVVRSVELSIRDRHVFKLLRSRILDLFGEGRGADKMLKDIFS